VIPTMDSLLLPTEPCDSRVRSSNISVVLTGLTRPVLLWFCCLRAWTSIDNEFTDSTCCPSLQASDMITTICCPTNSKQDVFHVEHPLSISEAITHIPCVHHEM
jgi:hypothetical protein